MRRITGALFGVGLLALGCGGAVLEPAAPPPPVLPTPKIHDTVKPPDPDVEAPKPDLSKAILAYVAAFNGGKLDDAAQAFGDEAEWVSAGSLVQPATGRAAIAKGWQELRGIFDIKVGVRRLLVSDTMWVAQGVLSGAHVGDFHGLAATKRPVGVDYVHVGWVEKGRIKRLLSLSNGAAFPGQIGYAKGEVAPISAAPTEVEVVSTPGDAAMIEAAEALGLALVQGDASAAKLADDATVHFRATGQSLVGREAITKRVGEMGALAGVKRDVKSVAVGPYVVTIGMTTGTRDKAELTFHTVEVVKMKDGKAVEVELYRNPKEIADQMPETAPSKKK